MRHCGALKISIHRSSKGVYRVLHSRVLLLCCKIDTLCSKIRSVTQQRERLLQLLYTRRYGGKITADCGYSQSDQSDRSERRDRASGTSVYCCSHRDDCNSLRQIVIHGSTHEFSIYHF